MTKKYFITHNKEKTSGIKLKKALEKVANDWKESGIKIYNQDLYAYHVTEETKLKNLEHSNISYTITFINIKEQIL